MGERSSPLRRAIVAVVPLGWAIAARCGHRALQRSRARAIDNRPYYNIAKKGPITAINIVYNIEKTYNLKISLKDILTYVLIGGIIKKHLVIMIISYYNL